MLSCCGCVYYAVQVSTTPSGPPALLLRRAIPAITRPAAYLPPFLSLMLQWVPLLCTERTLVLARSKGGNSITFMPITCYKYDCLWLWYIYLSQTECNEKANIMKIQEIFSACRYSCQSRYIYLD